MKSTEVYRTIREMIAPWCKAQGFRRIKSGLLGYYKPLDEGYLVFWFQCDQWGWDDFAGSGFIVEFQISDEPLIGRGTRRTRLPLLLNDEQLEHLRQAQNQMISQLNPPPKHHRVFHISPDYTRMLLERFKPVTETELNPFQFWHRYYSIEDVQRWAVLILDLLPVVLRTFLQGASSDT
jgi:hypothetical protein